MPVIVDEKQQLLVELGETALADLSDLRLVMLGHLHESTALVEANVVRLYNVYLELAGRPQCR